MKALTDGDASGKIKAIQGMKKQSMQSWKYPGLGILQRIQKQTQMISS